MDDNIVDFFKLRPRPRPGILIQQVRFRVRRRAVVRPFHGGSLPPQIYHNAAERQAGQADRDRFPECLSHKPSLQTAGSGRDDYNTEQAAYDLSGTTIRPEQHGITGGA